MKRVFVVCLCFAFVLLMMGNSAASESGGQRAGGQAVVVDGLSASLTPSQQRDAKPWHLTMSLENTQSEPIAVLAHRTLLTSLTGNVDGLVVTDTTAEPKALRYSGMMVKRGPIDKDDFVIIAPGDTYTHHVDLSTAFVFQQDHSYSIAYPHVDLKVAPVSPARSFNVEATNTAPVAPLAQPITFTAQESSVAPWERRA